MAVKNCRVIGAASGDISSERVYIRLETLTCINKKTQNITETTVAGYVAGEDGRTGIRGIVAIKDRELMLQSLLGGVLSGASSAVSQLSSPSSNYNPFTGDVNKGQSTTDLMKQAGGQGVGNALDRYAKYHIERAEMLQPVIQVAAGRQVDIVFTKGVRFNAKQESIQAMPGDNAATRFADMQLQQSNAMEQIQDFSKPFNQQGNNHADY